MKVIIQRVLNAKCVVNEENVSEITSGMLLLVGFTNGDSVEQIDKMVKKIINLRIFEDENKKMNLSIQKVNGEILSISQFTLYANPYEGNRPSFIDALNPHDASNLYDLFNQKLSDALGKKVKTGIFGEDMKLHIVCDGPVTISLEY